MTKLKPCHNAIALAVTLAVTPVFAQTMKVNTSGANGTFIFSNNLLGGYSLISATVGAVSPATLVVQTDDSSGTVTGTPFATYAAGASAPLQTVTLNSSNDLMSITSTGGNFQNAPKSTAANGGNLVINNLSYDASTNIISADVSGVNLNSTYTLATTFEQVFTVNQLDYSKDGGTTWTSIVAPSGSGSNAGPVTFAVPTSASPYPLEVRSMGLFLVGGNSGTVFTQFVNSLGLKGIGLSTLQAIDTYNASTNTDGFGMLTVAGTAQPVPETSSYVSFTVGLAGLATLSFAARRRSRLDRARTRV